MSEDTCYRGGEGPEEFERGLERLEALSDQPLTNSPGNSFSMQSDTRNEILAKIGSIAGQVLGIPDLHLSEGSTARDVPGWDSLTHVQIIIGVENAFGIRMTATEVAQLENAGSLVDAVERHQAKDASA